MRCLGAEPALRRDRDDGETGENDQNPTHGTSKCGSPAQESRLL